MSKTNSEAKSSSSNQPFGYYAEDEVVSYYEGQFASLEFPQLSSHLYRRRSRPFTINVEGIVGTGKSTFLTFFEVCALLTTLMYKLIKRVQSLRDCGFSSRNL